MANPQATALGLTVLNPTYNATADLSGAQAVAAGVTPGTSLIAAFIDGSQRGRSFLPPIGSMASQFVGATAAAAGTGVTVGQLYGSSTPATVVLPSVSSVSVVTDSAGNATGPLKMNLVPGTGDLVNASSVMQYILDPDVVVVANVAGTGTF
jgi:hypothetical protein